MKPSDLCYGLSPASTCLVASAQQPSRTLRWTPHPVIVTMRDNWDYFRVLYSYYTTITGWGVLLTEPATATVKSYPCDMMESYHHRSNQEFGVWRWSAGTWTSFLLGICRSGFLIRGLGFDVSGTRDSVHYSILWYVAVYHGGILGWWKKWKPLCRVWGFNLRIGCLAELPKIRGATLEVPIIRTMVLGSILGSLPF